MRISVIIPCYNGQRYLREAIESLLRQTRKADEIIVVDDGSTDQSAEIACSFGSLVRVIHQENRGLAEARNSGWRVASGDYFLFLDADDLIEAKSLELLSKHVQRQLGAVAIMDYALFEHDPRAPYVVRQVQAQALLPSIISGNIAPVHSWFVPRQILLEVGGFQQKVRIFEDWECWCRVALRGTELVHVPFAGAYYRRHSESMMANAIHRVTEDVVMGHLHVLRTLCSGITPRPELLAPFGDQLFWATWAGVHRAQQRRIACQEVSALIADLENIAANGPESITETRFAQMIRLLGFRTANRLRGLLTRDSDRGNRAKKAVPKPSWLTVEN